jgi:gas vesicle protein
MAYNNGGSGSTTRFIVGALVGVAAGMLLAPKPGREAREIIGGQARNWQERARDWRDRANYQAGRLRERANEQARRFRERGAQQAENLATTGGIREMAYNNEGSGSATWFTVGALVGVAVGMLLAPKPGRETREMIADQARNWGEQARNWRDQANYQAGRLRERANEQARRFRERGAQQAEGFRESMNDQEADR